MTTDDPARFPAFSPPLKMPHVSERVLLCIVGPLLELIDIRGSGENPGRILTQIATN